MLSLTPKQLCDLLLDGSDEAAFEVFEHAGPDGLRQFMSIGDDAVWNVVYPVILEEFGFLGQLCKKYQPYLSGLVKDEGIETFQRVLQLDRLHDRTMKDIFHSRQRGQTFVFFQRLRKALRDELGL